MRRKDVLCLAVCGALVGWLPACAPDLTLGKQTGTGAGGAGATTGTGAGGAGDGGGSVLWATTVAGDGDETPRSVRWASVGELVLGVEFTGTFDVDTLSSVGDADVAVARMSQAGKPISATRLGGPSPQRVGALAVDDAGSIYLAGDFSGSIFAGVKQANSVGGRDGYVARLDGAGNVLWIHGFGGLGHDLAASVAAQDAGSLFVVGTFTGELNLDPGLGPLSAGGEDAFVAKLKADGTPDWTVPIGDPLAQRAASVVETNGGHAVVLAEVAGSPSLGGTPLATAGGVDILLAELDGAGGVVWAKTFGTAGDDRAGKLAVDAAGNLVFTGSLAGAYDFGGGAVAGQAFVARVSPEGAFVASRGFESSSPLSIADVAVDGAGNILLAGEFSGAFDAGPTALANAGGEDAFVMKLSPGAEVLWARAFGGPDTERATAVTAADADAVVVTGTFLGSTTFGSTSLGPSSGTDLFLLALTP